MKDYFNYEGKVCVVTGAASGMGKATAEMLVDLGAVVIAMDINTADIPGVKDFILVDLSKKESIDEAFAKVPETIDCYFGVAGLSGQKTSYYTTFSVDFIANKYITETYLEKRMSAGATIAYVSSTAGVSWKLTRPEYVGIMKTGTWEETFAYMQKHFAPKDGLGALAYLVAKRCINYYTVMKSEELTKRGIRVNAILPGSTATGMKEEFEKFVGGSEEGLVKQNGASGRLATSEEMAGPLVFLNSDAASFISGALVDVDMGGCQHRKVKFPMPTTQDLPMALPIYSAAPIQKIIGKMFG